MKHEPTTNKLFSSRILKFSLITIFILFLTRLISFFMIACVMVLVNRLSTADQYKADVFLKIAELLNIPIAGAIATVSTAVIARYGLREVAESASSKGEDKT